MLATIGDSAKRGADGTPELETGKVARASDAMTHEGLFSIAFSPALIEVRSWMSLSPPRQTSAPTSTKSLGE